MIRFKQTEQLGQRCAVQQVRIDYFVLPKRSIALVLPLDASSNYSTFQRLTLDSFSPFAASMFGLGLSIFAVFFLGLLATLISHDYPYVGEWFEAKGEPGHPPESLAVQREGAVHALWQAVAIYGVIGIISGVAVCTHKVRGAL